MGEGRGVRRKDSFHQRGMLADAGWGMGPGGPRGSSQEVRCLASCRQADEQPPAAVSSIYAVAAAEHVGPVGGGGELLSVMGSCQTWGCVQAVQAVQAEQAWACL